MYRLACITCALGIKFTFITIESNVRLRLAFALRSEISDDYRYLSSSISPLRERDEGSRNQSLDTGSDEKAKEIKAKSK